MLCSEIIASLDTDIMSVAKVEKKFTVWCAEREKTHLKYTQIQCF
jgi:hypothetical protein